MRKKILLGVVLMWLRGVFVSGAAEQTNYMQIRWERVWTDKGQMRALALAKEGEKIYLACGGMLFGGDAAGGNWQRIFSVRGENNFINTIVGASEERLYLGTGNGLYVLEKGLRQQRLFRGKDFQENNCLSVTVSANNIFLGTAAGLFISADAGRTWQKRSGMLDDYAVFSIVLCPQDNRRVYILNQKGVFISNDGGESWHMSFGVLAQEKKDVSAEEELPEAAQEAEEQQDTAMLLYHHPYKPFVYLVCARGIYVSKNHANDWERFPDDGLAYHNIVALQVDKDEVFYAATSEGIFYFDEGRHCWQNISYNLCAGRINDLKLDNRARLYVAAADGLYMGIFDNTHQEDDAPLARYLKDEPSIQQVQEAAIRYAEVGAEKIKHWRQQARLKALLPQISVDFDKNISDNYELYTSSTTRYVFEGPRKLSSSWGVTLSWDLADLVWSADQTSIDVRSRLMVQLRDQILDEVTKLYFERIRLKIELERIPFSDVKRRLDREIRLKEITASLDALTEGFYSRYAGTSCS